MLQPAKWISLSVALHLAVATSLFFWGLRDDDQTAQIIMVVIDDPASTGVPRRMTSHVAARPGTTPAISVRTVGLKSPKAPHRAAPPAAVHAPPLDSAPQQGLIGVPLELPADVPGAAPMHQKNKFVDAAMNPLPQRPTQQGTSIEDVQQRYRKDHLIYIRELITRQLVYPPLALRMNWSGKAVVAFTIDEDGSASEIRIMETSGFTILDKSAIETIRKVAPFPKPPVRSEIVVPINFRMRH